MAGTNVTGLFLMWSVMMVAMMLPSAAPMVLLYARVGRKAAIDVDPFTPTGLFAAGYLLVWFGFALAATGAHWALERGALMPANCSKNYSRGEERWNAKLTEAAVRYIRQSDETLKQLGERFGVTLQGFTTRGGV